MRHVLLLRRRSLHPSVIIMALILLISSADAFCCAPIIVGRSAAFRLSHNARPQLINPCQDGKVLSRLSYPAAMSTAPLQSTSSTSAKSTAVYALIMANILIFIADKILRVPLLRSFYLYHFRVAWWQPLTSLFCHASRSHLSGNIFLLLLFGRSVEDDLGWGGLLFAFAFCGVLANIVSLVLLPASTVSIGASGAVFGLFTVSILSTSLRELDWRKVVEIAVLGEFVLGKVLSEMQVAATGGVAGINHVAHLSGAGAGVVLVLLLRTLLTKMEGAERQRRGRLGS